MFLIVLAAAATGPIVAGSVWNRAGAATLVGFSLLTLVLFAGSNLNEISRTGWAAWIPGSRPRTTAASTPSGWASPPASTP
ncbi:hypothetical protein ACFVYT_12085 [Streptomyces sp. NPDC058290]|uniref:hypothetical protein n=1 Tax=Streptomyces sp. NPDC058290 TaxID=3346426 RepID=UPI0036F140EC